MKKVIFSAVVSIFVIISCTYKVIPLSGNYPKTPIVFQSTKSFEQAWDKLIDIFAQKGLSIKIIDKSSGLIVSSRSELPTTMENKEGKPYDPNAFIVVGKEVVDGSVRAITGSKSKAYAKDKTKSVEVEPAYGDWNVRIKTNGSGTTINVNITNLTYYTYNINTKRVDKETPLTLYHTTGVFEKLLADAINE